MRYTRFTQWLVVALAAAVAGLATADDRQFLLSAKAEPNLIFILDTSSTMAASPEVVGTIWPGCDPDELVIDTSDPPDGIPDEADPDRCRNGAIWPSGAVPGAGDDPYSRMGIAKRVLRDFLEDVNLANVALAGYAQKPPDDDWGIPQKHWVYEARSQDRFHMVEPDYAYRFGYNVNFNDVNIDVPADVYKKKLIGYKLYFNPAETEVTDRYGPVRGYDTGIRETLVDLSQRPLAYDLMPVYFGDCFWDENHPGGPDLKCHYGIFPFYDSGVRESGVLQPAEWYYGEAGSEEDYPGCDPNAAYWDRDNDGSPDPDACVNTWEVDMGGGVTRHFQRRVRLEIPETYDGSPNHFIEIAADGTRTGNDQVPDGGSEDYDQDAHTDPDLDGDSSNDWLLYVQSVEEQRQVECRPAGGELAALTATPTKTVEDICQLSITNFTAGYDTDQQYARLNNNTPYSARIVHTEYNWGANRPAANYVEDLAICRDSPPNDKCDSDEYYWNDNSGSQNTTYPYNGTGMYARPLIVSWDDTLVPPGYVGMVQDPIIPGGSYRNWWSDIGGVDPGWSGTYDLCFQFLLIGGGYADANGDPTDLLCPLMCASINATPTPVPSPTATYTETPLGGPTPTPWFVPTSTPTPIGPVPTSPPLPTRTPTPVPTATPTFTPTLPVATPVG